MKADESNATVGARMVSPRMEMRRKAIDSAAEAFPIAGHSHLLIGLDARISTQMANNCGHAKANVASQAAGSRL